MFKYHRKYAQNKHTNKEPQREIGITKKKII